MVLLLFVCQCLNAKCKQTGTKLLGGLIFSICNDEVSIYLSGCPYTLVYVHILKWVSIKSRLTVCQTRLWQESRTSMLFIMLEFLPTFCKQTPTESPRVSTWEGLDFTLMAG